MRRRSSSKRRTGPGASRHGIRSRDAFTLIELLIVMVLLGIVAAVVVPAILQAARPNPAAEAAAPVLTMLRSAQRAAATRNTNVTVVLDPQTGAYQVAAAGEAALISSGTLEIAATTQLKADSARTRFVFHPTGSVDADSLFVRDGAGSVVIRLDQWTGAIDVVPQ